MHFPIALLHSCGSYYVLTCCSISVAASCPFSLRDVCCAWYERIFQKRNQLTIVIYPFLFHSLNFCPLLDGISFVKASAMGPCSFTSVLLVAQHLSVVTPMSMLCSLHYAIAVVRVSCCDQIAWVCSPSLSLPIVRRTCLAMLGSGKKH